MTDSVLWPRSPHTGAKHAILKLYLDRWFPILGKHNPTINYIDGFAGPGEFRLALPVHALTFEATSQQA